MNHLAAFLNPNLSADELQRIVEADCAHEVRLMDETKAEALWLRGELGEREAAKMLLAIADVHLAFGYTIAGTFAVCAAGALDAIAQDREAKERARRWRISSQVNREWLDFLERRMP